MTDLNEMAKTLAGLSNEERDKLADIFVEKHEPQADRLATMLGWSLQDKQMRKEETMLKETTNTCGTHLQGKFIMPYEALEIALGEPHFQYSPQKILCHLFARSFLRTHVRLLFVVEYILPFFFLPFLIGVLFH